MRTATAYENTYIAPRPERTTFERMEALFVDWRREGVIIKHKRILMEAHDRRFRAIEDQASDRRSEINNQRTQAEMRRAELEKEIYNVARLLVAEADAEVDG